ncbi:hypothetical protein GSI_05522 [Ganoderma sinense ZZ0214-1]|uniref:Uncharacterized protein n=1 Tax=Ganoderma sinense ZZ0214-1 TaxID=1077348 RepID=A0A2G8SF06_9APHY|nr:hypothetical protein GSI_05522 [Ganoderma sinense ZZ0214-1]
MGDLSHQSLGKRRREEIPRNLVNPGFIEHVVQELDDCLETSRTPQKRQLDDTDGPAKRPRFEDYDCMDIEDFQIFPLDVGVYLTEQDRDHQTRRMNNDWSSLSVG